MHEAISNLLWGLFIAVVYIVVVTIASLIAVSALGTLNGKGFFHNLRKQTRDLRQFIWR
jgi:hypothetical protein